MKSAFYRAFTPGLIIVIAFFLSALIAGVSTLRTSRDVVERYVSVWEEEIARNLLLKGDADLFERIKRQIVDVAPDVESAGDDARIKQANGNCFAEQIVSVTLYGTPAGELHVCRSPNKLLFRSLSSPVFAFGLSAGLLLAAFLLRRASREAANRALNDLAIRVAHDIRAPLMALKIAADHANRVADTNNAAALPEVKDLIDKATARISGIADELLRQHRSTSPSSTSAVSIKQLGPTIRELVEEKRLLTAGEITIDIHGSQAPSGQSPAHATPELERVLSNLLQNAIEATVEATNEGQRERRIEITSNEAPTEILITIRDNGVGIPADVLPRIGENGFSYGKNSGNGIGFSSARKWARSVGGDLNIRSLSGVGTEVRLTIPR